MICFVLNLSTTPLLTYFVSLFRTILIYPGPSGLHVVIQRGYSGGTDGVHWGTVGVHWGTVGVQEEYTRGTVGVQEGYSGGGGEGGGGGVSGGGCVSKGGRYRYC